MKIFSGHFGNSSRLTRLRMRLIKWLAGDMQVYINANIHEGKLFLKEGSTLMANSTLIRNKIYTETPESTELWERILDVDQGS